MSTFFPPWVVILVVVQSNVPLRTCFWPLYWTSSLCRCELMPVLLWNFYTGRMQIVMFQSVLFWNLSSEPFEVILLTNYKVFVFTNYLIFNAFSVPLFKLLKLRKDKKYLGTAFVQFWSTKKEISSICPLPDLSSHRVNFLERHSDSELSIKWK